jgi:hypothetical protein
MVHAKHLRTANLQRRGLSVPPPLGYTFGMGTPPGKRGRFDPARAKQEAFRQYQVRRSADGFEEMPVTTGTAWKNFVGERGQRLKSLLQSFQVLGNPRYPPAPETSLALVRDVLNRLGTPVPDVPPMRLIEWFISFQGGRPQGWREVPSGLAQIAANDGRPAVVVGLGAQTTALTAIVFPDESSNAANPTVLMVTEGFALDPGTVLQGFRGAPVRYFAHGQ